MINAKMTVSDLSKIDQPMTWRMCFTVNAPNAVNDPTGTFTYGLADRGDSFYIQVSTSAQGVASGSYGTGHFRSRSGQGILRKRAFGCRADSAGAPEAWSVCAWVTSTCSRRAPFNAASTAARCRGSPVPASTNVGTAPGIIQVQLPAPVMGPGFAA